MAASSSVLRRFLGIDKFQELFSALRIQNARAPEAAMSTIGIACAVLIAALPLLSFYTDPGITGVDFKTFLVGLAACLAIVYRRRNNIHLVSVERWKESLHLTHIAFALGCIPTLFILLLSPEALFQLEPARSAAGSAPRPAPQDILLSIAGVSVWAAITEEFIYRGLLISVLRRWKAIPSAAWRDALAVATSALIFGLAHLPTWGPMMSVALIGLGIGFGLAYIAIGEGLLPLIVYHLAFDILSLTFAIFGRGLFS